MNHFPLKITLFMMSIIWKCDALRPLKFSKSNFDPVLDVVPIPNANITCLCQPLFVHVLCGSPFLQENDNEDECSQCTNCSLQDLYMKFCFKGTLSSRFQSSLGQSGHEMLNKKNYCDDLNYNFKKNSTLYLNRSSNFKAICQKELDALCPSKEPIITSHEQKTLLTAQHILLRLLYTRPMRIRFPSLRRKSFSQPQPCF